jgi:hypothetical protein
MSAVTIFMAAVIIMVIGRWAAGQTAVSVKIVVGSIFGAFIIALLDHGDAQVLARGLAWIIFAVAVLGAATANVLKWTAKETS